ncbi:hypothetical protein CVU83_03530 [Candidatus Falkowbacteria bacterium HGW-Falkowbacteria-2]|uniref:DUF5673 domain-containing protein n=1 Tax=Candidatus Falkowbacteria bacterium HGW-Falkowbacteria-2 TaxID=2013769 RepID=A0A2N2DX58_9BACT|nr:MAG: hypothetical protein CVU83_03530 [Candidatus Falkowbacteria bacterium HGW-Falkowbacteria-2]
MPETNNNVNFIEWQVPEYKKPERSRNWYIGAAVFVFICLFFSFFTIANWSIVFLGANSNFLFALIIFISMAIMVVNDGRDPKMVTIKLGPEGIHIGRRFHDYDEIKQFCVLYKPRQSVKNLYLEFSNKMMPRLSIPLRRQDPLTVRNYLVRYLNEDLDRISPPLSEELTKLLRL